MRLFVAIDPPAPLRAALGRYAAALPGRLRLVPPEQLHLTLRFLGEVAEDRVEPLARALDAAVTGPEFIGYRSGATVPDVGEPREPSGDRTRVSDRSGRSRT